MTLRPPRTRTALLLSAFAAFAGLAAADEALPLCEPFAGYCMRDLPVLGGAIQDVVNTLYLSVSGQLPVSGGSGEPAPQSSLAGCLLQQDSAACAAAVPAFAASLTACPPNEDGLNCAFKASYDFLGADQLAAVLGSALNQCQTSPAAAICTALSDSGGAPDRTVVLSESVARGHLVYTETSAVSPSAKAVDGDISDWQGAATHFGGTNIVSAGEQVYTDYLFDAYGADDGEDARRLALTLLLGQANSRTQRIDQISQAGGDQLDVPRPGGALDHYGDATNRDDGLDLTELRWAADGSELYLLARVAKLLDANNLSLIVLADQLDGVSGMNGLNVGLKTAKFDRAWVLGNGGSRLIDLATGATQALGQQAVSAVGYTNALEAKIPRVALARADGSLRVAVMTARKNADGSYTPANLAYRLDEPVAGIYNERGQAMALFAGTVDGFSTSINLADLSSGRSQLARPGTGYYERQFASGDNISPEADAENGRLQPYGLYVPGGYVPAPQLSPLTFWLHYRGGKAHSGAAWTPRLIHQLGEEQNNLVVTPRGRGTSTWYTSRAHQDFFEVFADVHALFPNIDPARRYLSGYSMGGYGTYLFGLLYPDLFAAGFSSSGAATQGAWTGYGPDEAQCTAAPQYIPGLDETANACFIEANSGRANAQLNYRLLENARHFPLSINHGSNDELVPVTGIQRFGVRLQELGYRYDLMTLLGYEHFSQAIVDEWADGAAYLNQFKAPRNPRQVTYKVVPALIKAVNEVQVQGGQSFSFNPDGAYWVDGLVVRSGGDGADPTRFGMIDVQSDKLPADNIVTVPRSGASASPAYASTPVFSPGNHTTPYVRYGLDWQSTGAATTTENRFSATLTNLSAASLDLGRMALDLTAQANGVVNSDGPLTLTLTGVSSPVRVYLNQFERPAAVQGDRIVLALTAADLVGGAALIQLQPATAAFAASAAARPGLVPLCRSLGAEAQPFCDRLQATESQLIANCTAIAGANGQVCPVLGGNLNAIVDACRGLNSNVFCKVADTFLESLASSCRHVAQAPRDFCALLSRERIGEEEIAAYERGWTHRALGLQYELGALLPFVDGLFPATHNSFNSTDANTPQTLSGSDPNQRYGITEQLRMGIRAIEVDVHWMPRADGSGFGPTVCHGNTEHVGCTLEKGLEEELAGIRAWLDANPDQVIVLYLENNMDEATDAGTASATGTEPYQKSAEIINRQLGSKLYKPAEHAAFLGTPFSCNSGHPLEAGIAALRERGKQLYIHTEGCNAGWASLVFSMNAGNRHTQNPDTSKLQTYSATGLCGGFDRNTHRSRWTRYFEDGTLVSAVTGLSDSHLGSADDFRGMVRCGVNMPSLDHVTPSDPRLPAFVWSWESGQPSNSTALNCAEHILDARFRATDCAAVRPYACAKSSTNSVGSEAVDWRISTTAGSWRSLPACPSGYRFAVPRNGFENELLRSAKQAVGLSEVWLNYSDAANEGSWLVPVVRDADSDGVTDDVDLCPNTPAGQAVDVNGCPVVVPSDTTPDAYSFSSVSGVAKSTVVSSNTVTITGINAPSPISVVGGEYRINGGAYTSQAGSISNGNTVQLRHTSAATANTRIETTLTVGGVSGKFSSTTAASTGDSNPDAFTFGSKIGQAQNSLVVSDAITPIGYDTAAIIKAGAGTEYSVGCTQSNWTAAQGSLNPGQSICVRHTSASTANSLKKTSLQIGTTVGYFSSRTAP